ncbi:MAG: ATP-binding protein [Myxococcaceae bacterium]
MTRASRHFPAVLLTGPRQVGKTSLLRHLYPDAAYVTFDHPAVARQAEESPDQLLDGLKEPVILDEVQYVPSLFRHLKARIDERRRAGRFLLTGSHTFTLMSGITESLAGRCAILRMHSLGWGEVSSALPKGEERSYLVRGGYPELYADGFADFPLWYASYVASYLERDVRNLRNVGELRDFDRFLRAAALRSGQLLSYSELARDVGVAPNTAKSWISVLQASGQIFLLEPYHRSLGKRLIKSPKLYFLDTGLLSHFLGLRSWDELTRSPLAGALWESHVVGQLVRHFHARGESPPLWFWRTQNGDEVDVLIERGARFIAIEAKLSEVPNTSSLKGFQALSRFYGDDSVVQGFVACRTTRAFSLSKELRVRATDVRGLLDAIG